MKKSLSNIVDNKKEDDLEEKTGTTNKRTEIDKKLIEDYYHEMLAEI
ncbi:hypothetical protein JXB41_02250 [Candidatus Woesearchaeota archaeon]|nr:hypothetical protein [Candidatus Woesearchaeota archaeon]